MEGFTLSNMCPNMLNCLLIGGEVETWQTIGELIDKIRYYLITKGKRCHSCCRTASRRSRTSMDSPLFLLFCKLGIW